MAIGEQCDRPVDRVAGWRIEETAAEYVGCSGEKWFSLGFDAAFLLACISSLAGGFFPRRNWPRERRKTVRYGSVPSTLPLIASRWTRCWRVHRVTFMVVRMQDETCTWTNNEDASIRARIVSIMHVIAYIHACTLTKFLPLDTCREERLN